uniref:Uncharacterized protein n=1 Tax=Glossina pallidipes TaxID=7398 RepID=A0A1A9ZY88_GLOPL
MHIRFPKLNDGDARSILSIAKYRDAIHYSAVDDLIWLSWKSYTTLPAFTKSVQSNVNICEQRIGKLFLVPSLMTMVMLLDNDDNANNDDDTDELVAIDRQHYHKNGPADHYIKYILAFLDVPGLIVRGIPLIIDRLSKVITFRVSLSVMIYWKNCATLWDLNAKKITLTALANGMIR